MTQHFFKLDFNLLNLFKQIDYFIHIWNNFWGMPATKRLNFIVNLLDTNFSSVFFFN